MSTNGVSPHYATTTDDEAFGELETALRRQIKDTLDGVTTSYDKLDDRIQIVEQRLPKNLRFRLKTLEDHAKSQEAANSAPPNSAAVAAAALEERVDAIVTSNLSALQSTVDQHKQLFEKRVNAIVTSKLSALQMQVDQYKHSLDLVSKSTTTTVEKDDSVPELEGKRDAPLSTYSHDELARELLSRLESGQTLPSALVARIRLATELSPPSSNETPTSAARSRKRPAAPRLASNSPSPSELSSIVDELPAAKRFQSAPAPTPAITRASSRKISSMWKTRKPATAEPSPSKAPSDRELTAEELELLLQDEPRRSGRASKPARNPQFMTWLEVAAAKRRTSSE